MIEQDIRFLRSVSAEYYTKQADLVYVPPPVNKREIGFMIGHDKVMVRHKSFDSMDKIRRFLIDNVPWDAYHSCSVYEFPEKPIDEKRELWTELAFDIDPDQIDPECGNGSIYWICTSNDHCGKGMVKKCVNCGESTRSIDFIDPKCLSATGKEATKLIQALINELGISREDIRVYFSGNKGFHLYVSSDVLRELDQNGRKEIVDYLALEGLKEELFIVKWAGKRYIVNEGLGNRIIQNAMEIIEQRRSYPNIFTKEVMGKVDQAREKLRVELGKGSLDLIFSIFGGRKARRFLALAMEKSKVKVDPAVTLDLHRLFRMPGTLNSKSHLPKFPAELKMLGDNILDGMPEYGLNSVNIHVRIAPEIHMNGMNFGPFDNERAEVPAYLASYLITKGVATIV